jgi:hypothetical protein
METLTLYTDSEINLLIQILGKCQDSYLIEDFRKAITNPCTLSSEQILYKRYLSTDESWDLRCREPYGEAKVFALFYDGGHLTFQFCTRHLKYFLYKADLADMPLLLNTHFIGILASWRLQIAK